MSVVDRTSVLGRVIGVVFFALVAIVVGGAAFDVLPRLGPLLLQPAGATATSDLMRDLARTLGVTLSMLLALSGIAIPLTANVYTPKLIEIFLKDRVNRVVLGYLVVANAVVLWNKFVIDDGSTDQARLRVFVCLGLTLMGLALLAPYVHYVLSFLVPRTIVRRLEQEVLDGLRLAAASRDDEEIADARADALENLKYLGNVALRSVDRYDRDTAHEALEALRTVFDAFVARKDHMPPAWFRFDRAEVHGMGPELAREVERKGATFEVAVLLELSLVLPLALGRLPEITALIAALTRHVGVRASERHDVAARELVTLFFNTFLRTSLQQRSSDAFYKFVYQYRRFGEELLALDPDHAARVAFFLDYYGHQAVRMGLGFLLNVVAYDLAALCDQAHKQRSPAREELLKTLVALDRDAEALQQMPGVVKAQVILAARLEARGDRAPAARLEAELRRVPRAKLEEAFHQICSAHDEHFWEIADRRRHLDHVEAEARPAVERLREALLGDHQPGSHTQRFLAATLRAAGVTEALSKDRARGAALGAATGASAEAAGDGGRGGADDEGPRDGGGTDAGEAGLGGHGSSDVAAGDVGAGDAGAGDLGP